MKLARRTAIVVTSTLALAVTAFFGFGPERVWKRVAGPAGQGAVDFANLVRRSTPNDALACSPRSCPAVADIELPFYVPPPGELIARLDTILRGDRNIVRVDDGARATYRRYVARTPLMRFPDTLDAEATSGAGGTALILYSRSLIGSDDFGANAARLEALADALARW